MTDDDAEAKWFHDKYGTMAPQATIKSNTKKKKKGPGGLVRRKKVRHPTNDTLYSQGDSTLRKGTLGKQASFSKLNIGNSTTRLGRGDCQKSLTTESNSHATLKRSMSQKGDANNCEISKEIEMQQITKPKKPKKSKKGEKQKKIKISKKTREKKTLNPESPQKAETKDDPTGVHGNNMDEARPAEPVLSEDPVVSENPVVSEKTPALSDSSSSSSDSEEEPSDTAPGQEIKQINGNDEPALPQRYCCDCCHTNCTRCAPECENLMRKVILFSRAIPYAFNTVVQTALLGVFLYEPIDPDYAFFWYYSVNVSTVIVICGFICLAIVLREKEDMYRLRFPIITY